MSQKHPIPCALFWACIIGATSIVTGCKPAERERTDASNSSASWTEPPRASDDGTVASITEAPETSAPTQVVPPIQVQAEPKPAVVPATSEAAATEAPAQKPAQIGPLSLCAVGAEHGLAGSFNIVVKAQNPDNESVTGHASFTLRSGNKKDAAWEAAVDLPPGGTKVWRLQTSLELDAAAVLTVRFQPRKGKASVGEAPVDVPAEIIASVKRKKEEKTARFIEVKVQAVKQADGFFRYFIGAWNLTDGPVKGKLAAGKFIAHDKDLQGAGGASKVRLLDLKPKGFNQGYIDWKTGPPCEHGEFGVVSLGWVFESADGRKCAGNALVPNKITDRLGPGVEMAD